MLVGLASVSFAGGYDHDRRERHIDGHRPVSQRYDRGPDRNYRPAPSHYGHHYDRGPSFGQLLAGTAVVVGAAVVLDALVYPQGVNVIVSPPPCRLVWQQAVDQYGYLLYDQYGRPVVTTVEVCPTQY